MKLEIFFTCLLFYPCYSFLSRLYRVQNVALNAVIKQGTAVSGYEELSVKTSKGIHLVDITKDVKRIVTETGIVEGTVTILSKHTTTGITINEMEPRLVDDIRQYFLKLVPPDYPYLHNDLHLRKGPIDWPGGDDAWRKQEPVNCHSHIISMIFGNSESIPVSNGQLKIGTWQSVIVVECDGPRSRNISVQVTGIKDCK